MREEGQWDVGCEGGRGQWDEGCEGGRGQS